jgi:excisionase family DNA binding protein
MATEQLLLTPEEAAQALGIGRDRIFRLIASGEIKSIKIAKSRRIPVEALKAYVERLIEQAGL